MDFMPSEPGPQQFSTRPPGRAVLVAIAVGGVVFGAAAVFGRSTAGTSREPGLAAHAQATGQTQAGRPANAEADIGPGFVESDVAIIPEARR